jgi:transposase-like protein
MPKGVHDGDRTPKRTPDQIQLDRAEMVQLLRRGWTKAAIAEKFGLHPSQISYDWKRVLTRVQDDMRDEAGLAVAAQLERNAEVEREAWQAWEKSKQPGVKHVKESRRRQVKVEAKGDDTPPATESVMEPEREIVTAEGRVGDPRFLTLVQHCQEVERDLKGITPATQVNFNGTVNHNHNHQGAVGVGVFPWDALAGVAGAQALLGKGMDGRPVDPFGEAIARALGMRGLPAPEGTTLPVPDDEYEAPAPPPDPAPPVPPTQPPPPPAPATVEAPTPTSRPAKPARRKADKVPAPDPTPTPTPSSRKRPAGGGGKGKKGGK